VQWQKSQQWKAMLLSLGDICFANDVCYNWNAMAKFEDNEATQK